MQVNSRPEPNSQRELKVLIVDDVDVHRFLLKNGLRKIHPAMTVDEAGSGAEAQSLLSSRRYDMVLCDWMMPDLSGDKLLGWMRETAGLRKLPFIMISGKKANQDILQAFMELNVDGYIIKPFTPRDVYEKMMAVLEA